MRTDATIDRRQVRCPNASYLGYDKWIAQVGDLIRFNEGAETRVGRMIGRVAYAPRLDGDSAPVKDYILAAVLSPTLDYVAERWVNPADVVQVQPIRGQAETMQWFLSTDMTRQPVGLVRLCISELWSSFNAFMTWLREAHPAEAAKVKVGR